MAGASEDQQLAMLDGEPGELEEKTEQDQSTRESKELTARCDEKLRNPSNLEPIIQLEVSGLEEPTSLSEKAACQQKWGDWMIAQLQYLRKAIKWDKSEPAPICEETDCKVRKLAPIREEWEQAEDISQCKKQELDACKVKKSDAEENIAAEQREMKYASENKRGKMDDQLIPHKLEERKLKSILKKPKEETKAPEELKSILKKKQKESEELRHPVLEAVSLFCTVEDVKSTTRRVSFAQQECKPAEMTAPIMEQKDGNPARRTKTCQEEGIQSDWTRTCEKEQDGKPSGLTSSCEMEQDAEPSGLTPTCQAEKDGEPSDYRSKCNLEETEPVFVTSPVMQHAKNQNLLRGDLVLDGILKKLMENEEIIPALNFTKTFEKSDVSGTFTFVNMPRFERDIEDPDLNIHRFSIMKGFHSAILAKDVEIPFEFPVSMLCFTHRGTGKVKIKVIRALIIFNINEDKVYLEDLKAETSIGRTYIDDPYNPLIKSVVHETGATLLFNYQDDIEKAVDEFLKQLFENFLSDYRIPE